MMSLNEAKEVFINRAFIPTDDGSGRIYDPEKWREACYVISKWLEQEPCEDCVSRQAIIDMTGLSEWFDSSDSYNEFVIALSELPPVTPQPKMVTNAEEAGEYQISENISKGFEEFSKMMFKQGQVEGEG